MCGSHSERVGPLCETGRVRSVEASSTRVIRHRNLPTEFAMEISVMRGEGGKLLLLLFYRFSSVFVVVVVV